MTSKVHELITGTPDPHRRVFSARHSFDHETGSRSVEGLDGDKAILADVRLAFSQAGVTRPAATLPAEVQQVRRLLPEGFVRKFIVHLAEIEVDAVRIDGLSTAYSLTLEQRPVILLPVNGHRFHENWSLAHELGHPALGDEGVIADSSGSDTKERGANVFAAELLLPEARMREAAWGELSVPAVAEKIWEWGVSTEAVRRRLDALALEPLPGLAAGGAPRADRRGRRRQRHARVDARRPRRVARGG